MDGRGDVGNGAKRHGGPRAGSGRRSPDGAAIVALVTAGVDQDTLDLIRALGTVDGKVNESYGVRAMARELRAYRARDPGAR
jgi:hypothetical protein